MKSSGAEGVETSVRVLHLLGNLRPSGMERMLVSGLEYFKSNGISAVIVGQGLDHPYADEMRRKGYEVIIIPSTRTLKGAMALRSIVRDLSPDIVHIHTESAFAPSVLSCLLFRSKTKIVRTVHSIFKHTGRDYISRRLQSSLVDRFVSAFIAPSPDVAANESAYSRGCQLIYNWVDDRFFELSRNPKVSGVSPQSRDSVVLVGNCSPIKNHEVVLTAMAPLSLDLYFHGDEAGATEKEVGLLDLLESEGRLRHRGKGDPGPSLVAGSMFAVCSLREGMSVALAEAMTVGIPCLVSDVPGLQWARGWGNVTMVENTLSGWRQVLAAEQPPVEDTATTIRCIDFSARRGAEEYARLYQRVLQVSHTSRGRVE